MAPQSAWDHGAGLVLRLRPRLPVSGRLRGRLARLRLGALLVGAILLPPAAQAQSSFTWSGATTSYNLGSNWTPSAGAPPVASGQSAVFDAAGSAAVDVTSGPIQPNSWTFTTASQGYTTSGAAVNFSQAGPAGGIIDNAQFQTITIANNIGETVAGVQVQVTGQSALVLSGNNSYSGGTFVSNSGVIVVDNNNSLGTGGVSLSSGASLFASAPGNLTFGNSFTINDATGNSIVTNGSLLRLNGNISGAGQLLVQDSFGGGAVVLNGTNTYTGGTTICSCGTLQLGDATHTGSIVGNVTNEGLFRIVNADMSAVTSITTDGGQTRFLNSSSAGNVVINTINNGVTRFLGNSTGGNAQFNTDSTGVVSFSGSIGPSSNGVITAGSIAGAGTYVIGGIKLVVGGNNLSTEVSGEISDGCGCSSGLLTKVGSGTLTLSGTSSYTGPTNVNGGTLLVTGSIASSAAVIVDTGATLGGTGTVPMTFLANGATLAPGLPTALGTLTVNDDLTFCSCTFYSVKVTSTGSDLTQVVPAHGTAFANLEGTVRVASLNSTYKFNSPYTILTAQGGFDFGGGPTRFDSLVTPTGIDGALSYTTTDVDLTLMSALGQLPGLNVNQRNVAKALDFGFNTTGNSGSLGGIFNGNIPLNLTQASGEVATGSQQATFNAMNMFLNLLTDPFIDGRGGGTTTAGGTHGYAEEGSASLYAARKSDALRALAKIPTKADVARNDLLDPRWSVWGAAYGGGADIDGKAALGSNGANVRAFGLAAGMDYRISPDLITGFALAGGGTNFSVSGFGTGRSDLFQAGAFVRRAFGAGYVTGALAYGAQQVTTDRTVTVAGFDRLQARFNANTISGRIEGGYRFVTPWMGVTPYAAGQFTTFSLPAYAEQALAGTGAFALNFAAKDVTATRTELGVRTDRSYAMQDGVLTLRGRLAWAHDFNTDRNVAAVFQTLPGAAFVVNGAAQSHDSALTSASAEMRWLNGWSAAATVESELSGISRTYAGKGVVRYSW
jgi:autotransporter-associated beta strand protein